MNLTCCGPHLAGLEPVLGTCEHPIVGMLCGDCGLVYAFEVSSGLSLVGTVPDADKIAKDLKALKATADLTSYKPPKVKP